MNVTVIFHGTNTSWELPFWRQSAAKTPTLRSAPALLIPIHNSFNRI